MARVTKAVAHLSESEIWERIRRTKGFWRVQRWLAIRHALIEPVPARQIARRMGLAEQTVHNLIARYNRLGPVGVETPGRGQRQRADATLEEEQAFLEASAERAERGELATIAELKAAWEQRIGRKVHKTTIYRMLRRHGWRKLEPRPRHVKTGGQAQSL
jgi:transposase